jgi:phosphonate transport system substrate-binding protein
MPTMTLRPGPWLPALLAGALCVTAWAPAAGQDDCPRGTLDRRFCDRDGDLTADPPTDPKQWVDPATLVFAYTPVEDPEVYRSVWDGFVRHMEQVTGKKVVFFAVQSNAAQIEAMRAGRLHVAGFNTGSNPLAVNCAGFVPFAMMAAKDGAFGYEMEIITHVESGIARVPDLKGRSLAFTAPTSNSGFKAPSALLKAEFGLEADRDFKPAFSGKHDSSILGVVNKDYDAAAVANSVLGRMVTRKVVDGSKLRSIYKSQTFPTTGYGHVYNLKPALAAKVKEGFFSFPWDGSRLKAEFKTEDKFVPITYKLHWEVIRKIDQASNVSYACR